MNRSILRVDLGINGEASARLVFEHELGGQQLKIAAHIRCLGEIIVFCNLFVATDHAIVRKQFSRESSHLPIDFLKTKNVRIRSLLFDECGYALSNSAVAGV